jgi:hypothetical protein
MKLTHLQELQSYISDAYKDLYHHRPRSEAFWAGLDTVEACREMADRLSAEIGEEIERERQAQLDWDALRAEFPEFDLPADEWYSVPRRKLERMREEAELAAAAGPYGDYEYLTDALAA